jgi:uncharacterized protein YaaN involved in tellurite resistance
MEEKSIVLTTDEQNQVAELKNGLDIHDSTAIITFGASAQRKASDFVDALLDQSKTKELNEAGDAINQLVVNIKGFDANAEEGGFLAKLFSSAEKRIEKLRTNYRSVSENVERVVDNLERHRGLLMQDVAMLDKLYEKNVRYADELRYYIVAGEEKIVEVRDEVLPAMKAEAEASQDQIPAQRYKDVVSALDRLEKKVHDLKLTRTVTLQMLPQIRLQQGSNTVLVEKIQSSIVNAIPLWKSQLVIALGLANTENALKAQQLITDTTNELLRKNSEMLKTGTIETAKAAERGIVDIETIKKANEDILSTIQEVAAIQKEGRTKRLEAESELKRIESELKENLIKALE